MSAETDPRRRRSVPHWVHRLMPYAVFKRVWRGWFPSYWPEPERTGWRCRLFGHKLTASFICDCDPDCGQERRGCVRCPQEMFR